MNNKTNEKGQATVEMALIIPFLALFLLIIVYGGIVIRQHILVSHASREAARVLSVENDHSKARSVVNKTVSNADVTISRPSKAGEYLRVDVRDTVQSPVPIVGVVLPDITVSASTTMRVEK